MNDSLKETVMNIDYKKIKLVIWDLDDCFWKGTLSEGPISSNSQNIQLVRDLTDRGIVNSICSKNTQAPTEKKLEELGVLNLFVFRSINWQPKGQRISKLIKDMRLRSQNCLFIDDNRQNLKEASFYEPELMTIEPSELEGLINYINEKPVSDINHTRLKNYKVLETKQEAKEMASDNMDFLFSSHTQVSIQHDCLDNIDRIYELVNRTNQLNYTKKRSSREELISICLDATVETGYVQVSDKYGEYGIVGFYAIKNGECIHFLFSCRTIGQGVEQYVYAFLNYPELKTKGEVINPVTRDPMPAWINNTGNSKIVKENRPKCHKKIVFKGGCDMKAMMEYLQSDNIIEEFNYVGETKRNNIEFVYHSVNYTTFPFYSEEEREKILAECEFADKDMFHTSIYDDDISLLFISTMSEPNMGIYRNREKGFKIAFGEYVYPLTDPKYWDAYVNKTIFTADNHFTYQWLKDFNERYEFMGRLTPQETVENIKILLSKINKNAKLCLMLGSTMPYLKNTQKNYENRHNDFENLNRILKTAFQHDDRVLFIDFNEYLKGQNDFINNINHFQRHIYYQAATQANKYISMITGAKVKQKNRVYLWMHALIDKIGFTGFYQTKFYSIIRRPYICLKSLVRNHKVNK